MIAPSMFPTFPRGTLPAAVQKTPSGRHPAEQLSFCQWRYKAHLSRCAAYKGIRGKRCAARRALLYPPGGTAPKAQHKLADQPAWQRRSYGQRQLRRARPVYRRRRGTWLPTFAGAHPDDGSGALGCSAAALGAEYLAGKLRRGQMVL